MQKQHKVIKWIEDNLRFPRRAGPKLYKKPVRLMKWQKDFIRDIYTPEGKVKKHTIFISGPRKCGKSGLISMIMIYTVFHNKDSFQEISVTAASFDQAKKTIFQIFKEFLAISGFKADKVTAGRVAFKDSVIEVVSTNPDSLPGGQPSMIVADEIGRYESRQHIDNLEQGLMLAENRLLIYLTNPSEKDQNHFSYSIYKQAKEELSNKKSEWAVCIHSAEPTDDIYKQATWKKANPNLSNPAYKDIVLKKYQDASKIAKNNVLEEIAFKRMYLGQWVLNDYAKFIDGTNWKIKEDTGDYGHIHAGIDLSLNRDRTAIVLTERTDDGGYFFRPMYYLPEPALAKMRKTKRELTQKYIDQGHITLQNRPVIDQDQIISDLEDIYKKAKSFDYGILDLHCGGFKFSDKLSDVGISPVAVHCYPRVLSPLINEIERADQGKVFYTTDNPVFREDFFKHTLNFKTK